MQRYLSSGKLAFFSYFVINILLGSLLLNLPASWHGASPVSYLDALFTAVSAVCVTGLATLDTSLFSNFGQLVLLYLIQAGGLGIITFSTLYLLIPKSKISLRNRKIIREYYVDSSNVDPRNIVKVILLFTFGIEILGFLLLALLFRQSGDSQPWFNGLFHAVSAFCNAGFSRYSDSLVRYSQNWGVNLVVMMLIILGGLGFMTIWDLLRNMADWRNRLHFHTRVMLAATAFLIISGWLLYYLLEKDHLLAGLSTGDQLLAALFQSVTTRTAGFNTVDQYLLSRPSQFLTLLFMIIGGGSGSTAGGLKVTTAVVLFLVIFRHMNSKGESRLFNRRIPGDILSRASMLFLKAMGIIFLVIFLLLISERNNPDLKLGQLIFEAFSALGTVGLSQGVTPGLTGMGKGIIMLAMFAGRVGLFALIMPDRDQAKERHIDYPMGEVLIG